MNQQDAAAVEKALKALDASTFADNVRRLGKGFGVAGFSLQGYTLGERAITGFKTGEWKPFLLELQSIAAGTLATAAAGVLLASGLALVLAPGLAAGVGFVFTGVILALVSSFIDTQAMEAFNSLVYDAVTS